MSLTYDEIGDFIRRELGHPSVVVELEDGDMRHCIDHSLRIYNRYMCCTDLRVAYGQGGIAYDDETTGDGSVVIQLEDEARGVCEVKVLMPESARSYANMSVFEIVYRMVFPRFPVSDWYFFRSYYEMFQEVRGTDPGWRFDIFTKRLYLDLSGGPYDVYYVVATDVTLDNIDVGFPSYLNDFYDLCTARAKMVLSKIRGKWKGVKGNDISLETDAAELSKEAADTQAKVIERLKNITRLSGPVMFMG